MKHRAEGSLPHIFRNQPPAHCGLKWKMVAEIRTSFRAARRWNPNLPREQFLAAATRSLDKVVKKYNYQHRDNLYRMCFGLVPSVPREWIEGYGKEENGEAESH